MIHGPQGGASPLGGRSIATRLNSVASFYAALALTAFFWHGATQDTNDLWHVASTQPLTTHLGSWVLGGAVGVAIVRAFRWLEPRQPWLQALREEFRAVLGPLSGPERLVLAAASALGEELLFRGAMLDNWGLVASTVVFGLIHVPPRWTLWPWTASSLVLGLVLGLLTLATPHDEDAVPMPGAPRPSDRLREALAELGLHIVDEVPQVPWVVRQYDRGYRVLLTDCLAARAPH